MVRYFRPLAVVVAAAVVAVSGVGLRLANEQQSSVEEKLDARYQQKIELRSESPSGNRYRTRVSIDGSPRDDRTEKDARLTCSDDPQPTLESAAT